VSGYRPAMTGYQRIFKEAAPNHNCVHIEMLVREAHRTLDHLTREELTRLARQAAKELDAMDADEAASMAETFGYGYPEPPYLPQPN